MNRQIPLGKPETQKLEFKGKDALRRLMNVSREVVGMLNAGGGEIWIGLGEENGIAVRIEPIENSRSEISRLRDHFSDAIEPSPVPGEIEVEEVAANGGGILRVAVKPEPKRTPYALREGTARHFHKRVGDRLRSMSSEEIREAFRKQSEPDPALEQALKKMRDARDRNRDKNILWMRIQPVDSSELAISQNCKEYFTNPSKTGNRRTGWNFVNPYADMSNFNPSRISTGAACFEYKESEHIDIKISRAGEIDCGIELTSLFYKNARGGNDFCDKEIWPYCLLEYPTSIFRLAGAIYYEQGFAAERFIAGLAMFGVRGWSLRPHSPESIEYKLARPNPYPADEIVSDESLSFTRDQIINEPDRCGFRLVARVYQAFGIYEEQMPFEFNRETGKLVFPGP